MSITTPHNSAATPQPAQFISQPDLFHPDRISYLICDKHSFYHTNRVRLCDDCARDWRHDTYQATKPKTAR